MVILRSSSPHGDLSIHYEFAESEVGQRDAVESADLAPSADGKALVLTIVKGVFAQSTSEAVARVHRYEIAPGLLEQLIVAHGREIKDESASPP